MKSIAVLAVVFVARLHQSAAATPQAAVDELLAADRAFAAASAKTNLIEGLSAMFSADVVMTGPAGLAYGKTKAVEALRINPLNTGARIEWVPVRGAVSADGLHGFTLGFMTLYRADGTKTPVKYLGYWQKDKDGWRVTAYKRGAGKGQPPLTMMPPILPNRLVAPSTDANAIDRHRESLAQVERDFSREAQSIGIGPAFKKYGSEQAINLGGPEVAGVLVGADAISSGVGAGSNETGSPVSWGPEKVIVATSGDLGVSIGYIDSNKRGADGKPERRDAFFTIWIRPDATGPWKYIAE